MNSPYDTVVHKKAAATRKRRQYATKAQQEAFKKSLQRDGEKSLTITDLHNLATHPDLLRTQRDYYTRLAIAMDAA